MSREAKAAELPRNDALAVTLTVADIRQLVTAAVSDAIADHSEPAPQSLLTTAQLAKALAVCPSTILNMRRLGMPTVMVIESPRFELDAVLTWLRERSEQPGQGCARCSQVAENKDETEAPAKNGTPKAGHTGKRTNNSKHLRSVGGQG